MANRLVYQDWIVKLGRDPDLQLIEILEGDKQKPDREIVSKVRSAISKLSDNEQMVIIKYYFEGCSLPAISEESGITVKEVDRLYRRAIYRLRNYLASFVKNRFDPDLDYNSKCPICNSPYREEIDRLIIAKKKEETWKRIISVLKNEYQIKIKTPQILIGHQKYHLLMED